MLGKTAMGPRSEQQARTSERRIILPASAEPGQAPRLSPTYTETAPPPLARPPVKEAIGTETAVEKIDTRKAEAEERERRKQSAERKARRLAAVERAKRPQPLEQDERREPPIVAFSGGETRLSGGFGFFGN
jgi:hypothetical protein